MDHISGPSMVCTCGAPLCAAMSSEAAHPWMRERAPSDERVGRSPPRGSGGGAGLVVACTPAELRDSLGYDPRVLNPAPPPLPGLRPGIGGQPPSAEPAETGSAGPFKAHFAAFQGRLGRPLPRAFLRALAGALLSPAGRPGAWVALEAGHWALLQVNAAVCNRSSHVRHGVPTSGRLLLVGALGRIRARLCGAL